MRICHRSISLFASLLLIYSYTGFSQQLNFSLVSSPVEAPWSLITGMAQDKNGVMWFTTNNGLGRYDGHTTTTYLNESQNPNSLADNRMECIYIDTDGIIWLGLFGGLDRFDPATKSYTHYRHNTEDPASLIGNDVKAILEDSEGILWVGTSQGLCSLDRKTGKFTQYKSKAEDSTTLSDNMVKAIYEDSQGTLWFGTGEAWGPIDFLKGGLNRIDRKTGKFTRFMHDPNDPNSLIDNRVRAICEDSRGNFWVGTAGDGLHLMDRDKGTFQRLTYDPKHPEKLSRPPLSPAPMPGGIDHITFIREDATGAIWIGTMGAGVNRFDPNTKKITHYGGDAGPGGLMDEKTWWSYLSVDGVLWISSLQNNLYRVDPSQTQIPSFNSDPSLFRIFQSNPHILWEVTYSGLIQKDLRTGSKKLFNQDSFIDAETTKIRCLTADREGVVWVGTTEGLHRYDSVSQSFAQYVHNPDDERSLPHNFVSAILEDQVANLWVAAGRTLSMLDRKTGYFTHYQNNPADSSSLLAPYFVSAIVDDEDQNYLWVGSQGGGINRLNKQSGKFEHYRRNDYVNAIVKDLEGVIWVATNAGLFKFNQKENDFEKFKDPTGFIEVNYANSVTVDNQNNLWLYRANGIVQIKNKGEQIVLYSRNNGVKNSGFYNVSKDLDGRLYFTYYPSDYYSFVPDSLPRQDSAPIIFIEDFRVASESLEDEGGRYKNVAANELSEINLSYDQNAFTFDFVPIHYSSPEDNRVVFKLENYDKDWRKPGSEKTAQYFNVPPGHYTFRIKASTNMGIYTERAITVYLAPPWWRTWWAYGSFALIFIGGVFLTDRYQRRRLLAKATAAAKEKELEQAREIEKAYTELKATQSQLIQSEKMASLGELTAGIAHEIQNPLNFVNNFSEVNSELISEMKEELIKGNIDEVKKIASNIDENEKKIIFHGKRADGIVKGMLQHSRSSSGVKEPTNINALADEYLRLAYHGLRAKDKSFNATMNTDFDESLGAINVIPQDMGRVILNLITNAFYSVMEKKNQDGDGYEPTVTVSTKHISPSGGLPAGQAGGKGEVIISVKDNGNGIPQKVLDKIFQPFFTTKPTGQGTGLGLSMSYDIVTKSHNGELKVETTEGLGSTFIIILPI